MTIHFRPTSLYLLLLLLLAVCFGASTHATKPGVRRTLLFTSQGKTGLIHSDGTGLRYFGFRFRIRRPGNRDR